MSKKKTILIVEDQESLAQLYKDVLSEAGYRLLFATTVSEAFMQFLSHASEIDLILLDIFLPLHQGTDENIIAEIERSTASFYEDESLQEEYEREIDDLMGKNKKPEIQRHPVYPGLNLAKLFSNEIFTGLSFPFTGRILVATGNFSTDLAQKFYDIGNNVVGFLVKPIQRTEDILRAVEFSLDIDLDYLVTEGGDQVLMCWGGRESRRHFIMDKSGIIWKTGTWRKHGIYSVCLPVIKGYCSRKCAFCSHTYAKARTKKKMTVESVMGILQLIVNGTALDTEQLEPKEDFIVNFTGEGEPADNRKFFGEAVRAIHQEFGDQAIKVLVSTISAGFARRLLKEDLPIPVQLQLSASFMGKARKKHMPRASSLEDMLLAGLVYYLKTNKRLPVILNYVLIKGVNDRDDDFDQFIHLIKTFRGDFFLRFVFKNRKDEVFKYIKDELAKKGSNRDLFINFLNSHYSQELRQVLEENSLTKLKQFIKQVRLSLQDCFRIKISNYLPVDCPQKWEVSTRKKALRDKLLGINKKDRVKSFYFNIPDRKFQRTPDEN